MTRGWALYGFVAGIFAASEILARVLGIRFAWETLDTLYQYLDPAILESDLTRGLYYLHSQPPLFNLGIGLVLKVFPESFPLVFSVLLGASALALLLAMAWLLRRLGAPDGLTFVVLALFALSPNFLVYRHWLFYTLPVALLLVAAGVALLIHCETGRTFPLVSFAFLAGAVMVTRSLFHPLWLVLVVAALGRRRIVFACLAPLVVVGLLFLKNYFLVGSFNGSTWLGLSLAKRWPLSQDQVKELKDSGEIPPYWSRRPFQEPDELQPFGFFKGDGPTAHPALDAPYKANGKPNFNHRDYVVVSDALLEGNLRLIRRFPARYLERTATALLLFLQPGPNSVHFLVEYDFERVHRYRDFLTRTLFLGGRVERPIRMLDPRPNLLLLLFPALVGVGAWSVWGGPRERRALHTYMLVTVLWVTAVANGVEIGENDRMRWEIEPFLAIWFATLSMGLWKRFRRSRAWNR
jgi:hypothetical protein